MEWISVEDRFPENEAYVLVVIPFTYIAGTMLEVKGNTIITLMFFDREDGKYWFNDQLGEEVNDVAH